MADQLRHLLDRLDDDTLRSIAILRMHGHSVAEIATKLGRVHRAIERKLDRIRVVWRSEID
jgi:IS30 family transposase